MINLPLGRSVVKGELRAELSDYTQGIKGQARVLLRALNSFVFWRSRGGEASPELEALIIESQDTITRLLTHLAELDPKRGYPTTRIGRGNRFAKTVGESE